MARHEDMSLLARTKEEVTPEWLTFAFRRAGVLKDARVTDIQWKKVGNGMFGDSIRFALTYDRQEDDAPASIVGKFAATDPVSKKNGAELGLYAKEINFYQHFRDTVKIRTPRPYHAEIDPETKEFTLLLEDMTPARGGDQIIGCSVADAEHALDQAAALHGPRWAHPSLQHIDWLPQKPELSNFLVDGYPGFMAEFRSRYDGILEPELMAFCQRFADNCALYYSWKGAPPAPQHTDFRLDNMLFDIHGGAEPLVVLDWQSISIGYGMLDVSYFIGAGLLPDVRRSHERALIDRYMERLKSHGVSDYAFDDAWTHYRIGILQGVTTAIFASVVTDRTPRGDQMFLTMARRHAQHAIDLDSLGVLEKAS